MSGVERRGELFGGCRVDVASRNSDQEKHAATGVASGGCNGTRRDAATRDSLQVKSAPYRDRSKPPQTCSVTLRRARFPPASRRAFSGF